VEPPQSTSVSVPFRTKSAQVGAWHVALHTALVQSAPALHVLPFGHEAQVPPPQSTADSSPFWMASEHVAG